MEKRCPRCGAALPDHPTVIGVRPTNGTGPGGKPAYLCPKCHALWTPGDLAKLARG